MKKSEQMDQNTYRKISTISCTILT